MKLNRRKIIITAIFVFVIAFGVVVGILLTQTNKTPKEFVVVGKTEQIPSEQGKDEKLRTYISSLSLNEKVGQMMMVAIVGKSIDPYTTKMIVDRNIGGVVLLGYNIASKSQVTELLSAMQNAAKTSRTTIPLFTAVDQEGGKVTRIKFDYIKDIRAQSELKKDEAFNVASMRGQELAELGFNNVLAPVSDFTSNRSAYIYSRTFQKSAQETVDSSRSMIDGYSEAQVIPTVKHFPGHGGSAADPHKSIVKVSEVEFRLQTEIFTKVLGKNSDIMLMTGHIVAEHVDSLPTSQSRKLIDYLRNDIGYDGVVITDDIAMLRSYYNQGIAELSVMAVKAGNDIILTSNTYSDQVKIYEAIVSAVDSGELSMEQIDKSVFRVLSLKCKHISCDFLDK